MSLMMVLKPDTDLVTTNVLLISILIKYSNVTTGKIYSEVLRKERKEEISWCDCSGDLHITDALKTD